MPGGEAVSVLSVRAVQRSVFATAAVWMCLLAAATGCTGPGNNHAPDLGFPAPSGPASPAALSGVVEAARFTLTQSAAVSFRLAAAQALGPVGQTMTGNGQFDLAASRGRAQLSQPAGAETLIFLPESVFVNQTGAANLLPRGKTWISAGLTEQSLATNFPQFVTQVESLNPALLLSEIEAGSTSVAPLPPVSGDAAYLVIVDLAKAQAGVSGLSATAFSRAISYEITEQSGGASPTVTVEVVEDRHGRIVALRSSPPGAGMGTVTLGLSGWGLGVSIAQPPRAKVVDISSLAPGGERENAGGGDSDGA